MFQVMNRTDEWTELQKSISFGILLHHLLFFREYHSSRSQRVLQGVEVNEIRVNYHGDSASKLSFFTIHLRRLSKLNTNVLSVQVNKIQYVTKGSYNECSLGTPIQILFLSSRNRWKIIFVFLSRKHARIQGLVATVLPLAREHTDTHHSKELQRKNMDL